MKFIKERNFWANENGASGVLPICTETKRICIALRSHMVNEPHTWGNFGGAIGKAHGGEREEALSPKDNALKEMREECDYTGPIEMIDSYIFRSGDFTYWNFLGLVPEEFELVVDKSGWYEVEEIKWVTLNELIQHEDLHFGLQSLIKNSMKQLMKYCR